MCLTPVRLLRSSETEKADSDTAFKHMREPTKPMIYRNVQQFIPTWARSRRQVSWTKSNTAKLRPEQHFLVSDWALGMQTDPERILGKTGSKFFSQLESLSPLCYNGQGLGLEYRILQLHQEFFFLSQQFPRPMARFLYKTIWTRRAKSSKFSRGGGYQADSMHFDDALINAQRFFSVAEIYF